MRSLLHLVRPGPRAGSAAGEGPVGARVRVLVRDAVERRASDMHLDPREHRGTRCRLRVDGRFEDGLAIEPGLHERIVARLKVLAGLPVYLRDEIQEGAIRWDDDVETHPGRAGGD